MKVYMTLCVMLLMAGQGWAEDTASGGDDTTTTTAGVCKDGKDEYCASCDGTKCNLCYASFIDGNSCKAIETVISNCLIHESATKCTSCHVGYMTDASACKEITEANCKVMNGDSCAMCDNGLLEGGKCPGTTACTIEKCKGCTKTDDTEMCSYCDDGYTRSDDGKTCEVAKTTVEGCASYSSDKCTTCMFGYYVSTYTSATDVKCTKSTRYESVGIAKWGIMALLSYIMWPN